ncbi:CAP domain-containing protein [Streptomyces yaizuensis]|uniref:CAP domain-containing protein n=1 Tax=Streptomyces yaizuensis TaxID=2989713 RepID=A0ABQ5P8R6_9ACTN|nr:CAP domain-containing protein [Streptomyces sp. YSPA8]GLF98979.1 CAP domain-containing protein [Streptomyces sp. YSPA8]
MGRHRRSTPRTGRPVRTGLLGASAALAVGAVAAASGLLPGGTTFTTSGERTPSGPILNDGAATLQTQGEQGDEPTRGDGGTAGPDRPAHAPSTSPAPKAPVKTAPEGKTSAPERSTSPERTAAAPERKTASSTPERTVSTAPESAKERSSPTTKPSARPSSSAPRPASAPPSPAKNAKTAESAVLALVNEERAKVGCAPVRFDASLAKLAGDFSTDMAARGFFSHTDPDGDTPWDRAEQAGVKNLGGENIARGQADAAAVMNSWMNSEGHRANILNCDYRTLGVGVHLGPGGPWWTQNFGF